MQTQGGPKLGQKLCWEAPRPGARRLSQCNGHHQLCFLGEETETGNVKDLCQEVETKHFLPELLWACVCMGGCGISGRPHPGQPESNNKGV